MIESDDVRFCSRCGFTLGRVRAAMAENEGATDFEVSVGSVNLGVILMAIGVLPPLIAVLTSPLAIPAAFLMLAAAFIAILLGSGPLLRLFQTGDAAAKEKTVRRRRKEIAFGSMLMFVGTILATMLVFLVPRGWELPSLVAFISGTFGMLLATSGGLYRSLSELISSDPENRRGLSPAAMPRELSAPRTAGLDPDISAFAGAGRAEFEYAENPPSVTERTTRHLDNETADSKR